jgi:thiol-disulfide isomerase/thioredoxin
MEPVDVRSPEDVSQFENILSKGPITIVLVYADWCGHCVRYKENVWSKLMKTPNRKLNLASVHYDQLENTSQKTAAIKGYPSVLVVGSDKKAATFPDGSSKKTNAFPKAQSLEVMEEMITKDPKKVLSAPKFVEDVEVQQTLQRGGGGGGAAVTRAERKGGLLKAIHSFLTGGGVPTKRRSHTKKSKRTKRKVTRKRV